VTTPINAFISHGGMKPSLAYIEDFLRAIGIEPVVVEKRPSEGREVHANVDKHRSDCDFAIALWTRDIEVAPGEWLPSGSVAVECGELRAQFPDRVIYLRESEVKLPTMLSTLAYETFSEENMGPAYRKIVTELHGWGWLQVKRAEMASSQVSDVVKASPVASDSGHEDVSDPIDDGADEFEDGLLDWAAGVEQSMEDALVELNGLKEAIEAMGSRLQQKGEMATKLVDRKASARDRLKLGSAAAMDLLEFKRTVDERVPRQYELWQRLHRDMSALVASPQIRQADLDERTQLRTNVETIATSTDGAILKMEDLQATVRDLRKSGLSRDLNRAAEQNARAIGEVIGLFAFVRDVAAEIAASIPVGQPD
jgi:hypothetical protein